MDLDTPATGAAYRNEMSHLSYHGLKLRQRYDLRDVIRLLGTSGQRASAFVAVPDLHLLHHVGSTMYFKRVVLMSGLTSGLLARRLAQRLGAAKGVVLHPLF